MILLLAVALFSVSHHQSLNAQNSTLSIAKVYENICSSSNPNVQLVNDRNERANSAYYFPGNTIFNTGASLNNRQEVTFAFAYKRLASSNYLPLFCSYNTSGANHPAQGYKMDLIDKNKLNFLMCAGNANERLEIISDTLGVNDDNWHFFVIQFIGTNPMAQRLKLFVDDKEVRINVTPSYAANLVTMNESQDGTTQFGCEKDSNGNMNFFSGIVDNLGLWTRTLTRSEITSLFNFSRQ